MGAEVHQQPTAAAVRSEGTAERAGSVQLHIGQAAFHAGKVQQVEDGEVAGHESTTAQALMRDHLEGVDAHEGLEDWGQASAGECALDHGVWAVVVGEVG